ncbi:MAG: 4-hydroxythreonine-4-phosphate dehydrogenase PdxA [Pirellulales bacterium]
MPDSRSLPLLAVTMGDPTGVGPEVIVAAWGDARVHAVCRPVVFGHPELLRRAVVAVRSAARVVEIAGPEDAHSTADVICCVPTGTDDALCAVPRQIDARGGQAAYDALVAAADAALAGRVDGIVTAPLNKAALWEAGHHYPGHTELLAEHCGVADVAMMLYLGPAAFASRSRGLGVVHVTLHTALRNVFDELSEDAILAKARLVDTMMTRLNGVRPTIGVCALNPHAGEEGLFGDEEQRMIAPAVARGLAEGLPLVGPLPTDTLMVRARDGEFDAVVAMYHDQGHIALKLLGMHHAVNITLGLPIVRTSVAHGTAFDLAWRGTADYRSMIEAIEVAGRLAAGRTAAE